MALAPWNHEVQNAAMRTPTHATKRQFALPPCFPGAADEAGKQLSHVHDPLNLFSFMKETGAAKGSQKSA
jgi:hypothetical protein